MNKLFALSFALAAASAHAGAAKPIDLKQDLYDVMDACDKATERVSEITCPQIKKFELKKADKKSLKKWLSSPEDANGVAMSDLTKATVAEAQTFIQQRVEEQVEYGFNEVGDNLSDEEYQAAVAAQKKVFKAIKALIAEKQKQEFDVYTVDGEWAPSVGASGVVLVREEDRMVYVIVHGDNEG